MLAVGQHLFEALELQDATGLIQPVNGFASRKHRPRERQSAGVFQQVISPEVPLLPPREERRLCEQIPRNDVP